MKHVIKWFAALIAACVLMAGCSASISTERKTLSEADAAKEVRAMVDSQTVQYQTGLPLPDKDTSWVGSDSTGNDLPPISKYPLAEEGHGDVVIEIASSTEKSDVKTKQWLDTMVDQFNAAGKVVNGKRVAVSVRPIGSGLALDYMTSRKYLPDAYTPSNELWAPMIAARGVKMTMVQKRLAGNAAGILMKPDIYASFVQKYGEVTMSNVVKAVISGDLTLGHTDPNVSSTGLNLLVQELLAMDGTNPLSAKAIDTYRQFQAKVPPVSPTTKELANVASKGLANAVIMEEQARKDYLPLGDWQFTPVGVRHDSPLYAVGDLSSDKLAGLRLFGEFTQSAEAQQSATSYGFNQHNGYVGARNTLNDKQLYGMLQVWKDNKDAGVPVLTMVVFDRSGSMGEFADADKPELGTRMDVAKQALRMAANYISPSNHIGLMTYDNTIRLDLPLGPADGTYVSRFVGAVNQVQPGGSTYTSSALVAALHHMLEYQATLGYTVKLRTILMSDGVQDGDPLHPNRALNVVQGLRVPVYGIAFSKGADKKAMQDFADASESSAHVIDADGEDAPNKIKVLVRTVS